MAKDARWDRNLSVTPDARMSLAERRRAVVADPLPQLDAAGQPHMTRKYLPTPSSSSNIEANRGLLPSFPVSNPRSYQR